MKFCTNLGLLVFVLLSSLAKCASAQASPDVPDSYQRLFYHFSDQRKVYEKMLNYLGLSSQPVGRSIALIAGVTQYPNLPQDWDRNLKPAAVDIEKLKSYLKDQEFFDEIIVLKDTDVNLEHLNYFLGTYLPKRFKQFPHSRFLFAYSGHGYVDGAGETARGFVLTSQAHSMNDDTYRIDLEYLRSFLNPDIDAAEKVLVLINACHSGAFLGRKPFGGGFNPLEPGARGAHAIMASRANQQSLSDSNVGPGSIFFEKIFAGLNGPADISPQDGVITFHELATYLHKEIPYVTRGQQTPMDGDISRNASEGEFFFLNRSRLEQLGKLAPWNPGDVAAFGAPASDLLELDSGCSEQT